MKPKATPDAQNRRQTRRKGAGVTSPTPDALGSASGVPALADLKANPRNPRTITPEQRAMLAKALAEFGDLGGIILNRRTGHLVGGHQRVDVFKENGTAAKVIVQERFPTPDATGTVAFGHVEIHGTRFSYREVDWPETKETAANIAANQHGGEFDDRALTELLKQLKDSDQDLTLTGFDEKMLAALLFVTRPQSEIRDMNAANEWAGMPSYAEGSLFPKLVISFPDEAKRAEFVEFAELTIDKKVAMTWATRWPFTERERNADKLFTDEPNPE